MLRGRRIVLDDSSDEEFPDIQDFLASRPKRVEKRNEVVGTPVAETKEGIAKNGTVRRRKLGAVVVDNPLLRPFSDGDRSSSTSLVLPEKDEGIVPRKNKSTTPQRIELRTRKTKPIITSVELDEDDFSGVDSVQEETILEDFSEGDDDEDNDEDDGSEFEASRSDDSDDEDFTADFLLSWSPSKSRKKEVAGDCEKRRSPSPGAQLLAEAMEAQEREKKPTSLENTKDGRSKNDASRNKGDSASDLADPLSKMQIHDLPPPSRSRNPSANIERPGTPPSPPVEPRTKGLTSPSKKISRIPATPHRPHMDTFWDQEFIDEWNDEYSPKKQLFVPSAITNKPQSSSPTKKTMTSSPQKSKTTEAAAQRAAKKAFAQAKHEVAERFLKELDERITDNKISELAASTGGIRIEWSNKLNTTAGRANWKRETISSKTTGGEATTTSTKGTGTGTGTVRYRHHASIELAEKVIDDEHRLLNVIAHEFCHLANFMITGITNNPHGKEFKSWGAKVTRVFGESRGIEVTTKHSYDIDFKYVWECTMCGLEFKRHSKSIHPDRHRCGSCKSELKQTKPVPRKSAAAAAGGEEGEGKEMVKKKESEYQRFMKEQMKVIREENSGIPQKDIMRMVASRWAAVRDQKTKKTTTNGNGSDTGSAIKHDGDDSESSRSKVDADGVGVAKAMKALTFIDLT